MVRSMVFPLGRSPTGADPDRHLLHRRSAAPRLRRPFMPKFVSFATDIALFA